MSARTLLSSQCIAPDIDRGCELARVPGSYLNGDGDEVFPLVLWLCLVFADFSFSGELGNVKGAMNSTGQDSLRRLLASEPGVGR